PSSVAQLSSTPLPLTLRSTRKPFSFSRKLVSSSPPFSLLMIHVHSSLQHISSFSNTSTFFRCSCGFHIRCHHCFTPSECRLGSVKCICIVFRWSGEIVIIFVLFLLFF